MTRTVYAILSWALAALGGLHMAATSRSANLVSLNALWSFSAGVLMAFCAALNLLNRTYGPVAPGVRRVCLAANLVVTAISVTGGVLSHAGPLEWSIVLGILVPLTVLSIWVPTQGA